MPTALITGPTSGIGNAFARQLAAAGWDLVLVSRDAARLEQVAAGLRAAHGIDVEVLPADLADAGARAKVADRLAEDARPVDLLVNNAGYSTPSRMLEASYAAEAEVLDVLVVAVLQLSHAAARAMVTRGRGGIVNVSSVAGLPAPRDVRGRQVVGDQLQPLTRRRGSPGRASGSSRRVPGFTRTEFHARGGFDLAKIPNFMWLDADAGRGRRPARPCRRAATSPSRGRSGRRSPRS